MNKVAIINRAVVGSGKSTMAKSIQSFMISKGLTCKIHSSDDLFMVDGKYCFDFAKLGHNHATNLQNFTESVKSGIDCVICDNTNVKDRDAKGYMNVAKLHGYLVIELRFIPSSVDVHASRNVHNVPRETIASMINSLENASSIGDYNYLIYPDKFIQGLTDVPLDIFDDMNK